MKIRSVEAAGAPQATGHYSQALEISGCERWLFVSGQIEAIAAG